MKIIFQIAFIQICKHILLPIFYLIPVFFLDINDFGKFVIALLIGQLSFIVCDFGQQNLVLSKSGGSLPSDKFIFRIEKLKLLVSGFAITLISIFSAIFYFEIFILCCMLIAANFLNSWTQLFLSYWRSNRNYSYDIYSNIFSTIIPLIIMIIVVVKDFDASPMHICSLILLGRLASFNLALLLRSKYKDLEDNLNKNMNSDINHREVLLISLISFLSFSYLYIDQFIIQIILGYDSVAIYQVAMRCVLLGAIIAEFANYYLFPKYSKLHNEKILKFRKLLRDSCIMFSITLIMLCLIEITRNIIVASEIETPYEDVIHILPYLYPVLILRNMSVPFGIRMYLDTKHMYRLISMISTLIFILIFNYLFLEKLGLEFAAVTISLGHLVLFATYVRSAIER